MLNQKQLAQWFLEWFHEELRVVLRSRFECTHTHCLEARFWHYVDVRGDDDCWPWQLKLRASGHGEFCAGGWKLTAPRYAYESANLVELDAGQVLRHICENPACCNPSHLELGTWSDVAKRRGPSVCGEKGGRSRLTSDQVYTIRRGYDDGSKVADLAKRFSVDRKTIVQVGKRKTWAHLPEIREVRDRSGRALEDDWWGGVWVI